MESELRSPYSPRGGRSPNESTRRSLESLSHSPLILPLRSQDASEQCGREREEEQRRREEAMFAERWERAEVALLPPLRVRRLERVTSLLLS